jgi:hypothetical protein
MIRGFSGFLQEIDYVLLTFYSLRRRCRRIETVQVGNGRGKIYRRTGTVAGNVRK